MPTYKGNVGNLMQHWTLCELLHIASDHTTGLSFIDAHAMAPLAQESTETAQSKRTPFKNLKNRLPNRRESTYEWAWHRLSEEHQGEEGYPNSASFVEKVWYGDFSLLLCEIDQPTIAKLKCWCEGIGNVKRCTSSPELHEGDWRKRFDKKLPRPSNVGLPDGSLTLLSFDPNVISWHRRPRDPGPNIYPEDLQLVRDKLAGFHGGVLLQVSTYGTNGDNTQGPVISSVNSVLAAGGFSLAATVVIPDQRGGNESFRQDMMSLVYSRNVPWSAELANLPRRFAKWARAICE